MGLMKWFFWPLCKLMSVILTVRHFLYDKNFISQVSFEIPLIIVGNLNLGGAGKTPMTEYLTNLLIKAGKRVAVLSRGYKRNTQGFIIAREHSKVDEIGDEPFQIYNKFKENPSFILAVHKNRADGIERLQKRFNPDVIILDDAFQHRELKSGMKILLTPFHKPFYRDRIFPCGNLRDLPSRAHAAHMIVVTKTLVGGKKEIEEIRKKLQQNYLKPVFFSYVDYGQPQDKHEKKYDWDYFKKKKMLILTGIADPQPFYEFLKSKNLNFVKLSLPDHEAYGKERIKQIKNMVEKENIDLILTTEKDFFKIKNRFDALFYVPIKIGFLEQEKFNSKILHYVNTGKFV